MTQSDLTTTISGWSTIGLGGVYKVTEITGIIPEAAPYIGGATAITATVATAKTVGYIESSLFPNKLSCLRGAGKIAAGVGAITALRQYSEPHLQQAPFDYALGDTLGSAHNSIDTIVNTQTVEESKPEEEAVMYQQPVEVLPLMSIALTTYGVIQLGANIIRNIAGSASEKANEAL